jgi:hypothetical protein
MVNRYFSNGTLSKMVLAQDAYKTTISPML